MTVTQIAHYYFFLHSETPNNKSQLPREVFRLGAAKRV